jgi:hypothetical protein
VVRPAADGSFAVRELPAGTYRLAALTDVETGEEKDAAFLEAIHGASVVVAVRVGQTTRQDLRIR